MYSLNEFPPPLSTSFYNKLVQQAKRRRNFEIDSVEVTVIFIFYLLYTSFGSNHLEQFYKNDVARNFATCTAKQLCRSLFFNKVAGLRLATSSKKETLDL